MALGKQPMTTMAALLSVNKQVCGVEDAFEMQVKKVRRCRKWCALSWQQARPGKPARRADRQTGKRECVCVWRPT